ncbi:MAG: cardiolipin synthase ClsB [Sterolibacterium sp.]|nr:cardiolipin synthase ClsB [Sterolibacterium sp.]
MVNIDFLPGNRIDLLCSGSEYFPALLAAIDAARFEVHLETYIFVDDTTGTRVAAALVRAAQRSVAVRVLVDGFGSPDFMKTIGPSLMANGVEVLIYGPDISPFTFRRHRLRRLHRKLTAIDARIAFVGGINIIDDMNMENKPKKIPPRYDYAVRIEGPLLAPIHASMRHLWKLVGWTSFRRRYRAPNFHAGKTEVCGNVTAVFLIRDNLRHRRDVEDAYLEAIASAQDDILLASAYFLPGRRFRQALIAAARRGAKVTVLLQGRVEYALLHYATQSLYGALLGAGVRIFEYHRSFLHAKVAVIDRRWATVGSSNIDPFSLLLAREANVIVRSYSFAEELRDSLQMAMDKGAQEIRREDWQEKPLLAKVTSWLAFMLVRLMIGLSGYTPKGMR